MNCDLKNSIDEKDSIINSFKKDNLNKQIEIEKKDSLIQNLKWKLLKADLDNTRMKNEYKELSKKLKK